MAAKAKAGATDLQHLFSVLNSHSRLQIQKDTLMVSPVVQQIILQQEKQKALKVKIKKYLNSKHKGRFNRFVIKNKSKQDVLSEIMMSLREEGYQQLSDESIIEQLGEHYTCCVVYLVKGWYFTVNNMSPCVFEAFEKVKSND